MEEFPNFFFWDFREFYLMELLAIFLDETIWKNTREMLEETQEIFLQVFLEESVEEHLKDSPKEHLNGFLEKSRNCFIAETFQDIPGSS